jgi:succinate dehydrogenase / fumarate reductase cytochrome b subunit
MMMAELNAGAASRHPRPLSPHLQVYKMMLTFVMSGFHRVTGFVLYFGILVFVWWLLAAASGPNAYAFIEWFIGSLIGRLVLLGYTWGLIHHTLGGVRHLIWDTGRGFEPAQREMLALATIVGSVSLTIIVWVIGYFAMGGLR